MSLIDQINLTGFRNFDSKSFEVSSGLNLISGRNGSGKTTLLEAVYVFAYGRSFRSATLVNLVNAHVDEAVIFLKALDVSFGWSKSRSGDVKYHVNKKQKTAGNLVRLFPPCLFIDASSHRAFGKQSVYRRQLLDWGVYHSSPDFGSTWNIYQRALKQRNAAIKLKRPLAEIRQWDDVLIDGAEKIKLMRSDYMEKLKGFFEKATGVLAVAKMNPSLDISHGWEGDFASALRDALQLDLRIGYTTVGPHRGKIDVLINGAIAKDGASEGQQKLLHYALRLAQAQYLYALNKKQVVFLIDDIGAELDESNQVDIIEQYLSLDAQLLVTNISKPIWHGLVKKEFNLD